VAYLADGKPDELQAAVERAVDIALDEDTSHGDVTSETLIPASLEGRASMLVKAGGMLAGGEVAKRVFLKVDPSLAIDILVQDGAEIKRGDIVSTISGKVIGILRAERVALNFIQRLSGIATQTARYVARTRGTGATILDTRKTTPGLRLLEKYAVRMGGGTNHRLHLADGVLIKDNHLVALRFLGMGFKEIVAKAKKEAPKELTVEVEVTTMEEALEAAEAGADIVMLDNMDTQEMGRVVSSMPGQVRTEASGGITLENVREAALAGVNVISIGALTHSSKALDISLELESQSLKLI
jgi:nicotinate-nucleotide pyrophosphorylase (carboxylating)